MHANIKAEWLIFVHVLHVLSFCVFTQLSKRNIQKDVICGHELNMLTAFTAIYYKGCILAHSTPIRPVIILAIYTMQIVTHPHNSSSCVIC